ncbi:MAG: hypothetical protein NVSMB18_18040 [Acetobacteraceae bacterium]
MIHPTRRLLLASLALPALQGCSAAIPPPASAPNGAAAALLDESAAAHGRQGLAGVGDLSVSYAGEWRALVGRLQPALVDEGYRGTSEERLLLPARLVAQAHTGPAGRKQVLRRAAPDRAGDVRVWYDGQETADTDRRHAAALVADGYGVFLLGPMLLAGSRQVRDVEAAEPERIRLDGSLLECDVVRLRLVPGLGLSDDDQLALYIDRATRLMRRVRFTLNGLDGTRGAVAEVDTFDHVAFAGVQWPTRFHEHLLRPFPLPVHDWRLTGLDLNRGLDPTVLSGPGVTGRAAAPATRWVS